VGVNSYIGIGSSFHFTACFQIPSLAMLRTASLLSRRAIESSSRMTPAGSTKSRNSSAKSINKLVKRASINSSSSNSTSNNSNNNNLHEATISIATSNKSSSESEGESRKKDTKAASFINLMVTTSSNRQSFTTMLGNTESFGGIIRTLSREKYARVQAEEPIELGVIETRANSSDSEKVERGSERGWKRGGGGQMERGREGRGRGRERGELSLIDYKEDEVQEKDDTEEKKEEEEERGWVLVAADRITFLRVVAQRIETVLSGVRAKVCSATGRDLADILAAGVDGKPFLAAILYPPFLPLYPLPPALYYSLFRDNTQLP
jgi:hypothetical protein